MLQNDRPTQDHWYMVIVPQQATISSEDVALKLKGALTFTEGVGQVDVDIMGPLSPEQDLDDTDTIVVD